MDGVGASLVLEGAGVLDGEGQGVEPGALPAALAIESITEPAVVKLRSLAVSVLVTW